MTFPARIAILGFVLAAAMVVVLPRAVVDPDSTAYRCAMDNLASGQIAVDSAEHWEQVARVAEGRGRLLNFVQHREQRWILEKAPGFVFLAMPACLLGLPGLFNFFLALACAATTWLLLSRLNDEWTAAIGVLLLSYTPLSLIFWHRSFHAMFASHAVLAVGAGLYLDWSFARSRHRLSRLMELGFSALLLSLSVTVRYSNAPIVALLLLHYLVELRKSTREGSNVPLEPALVFLAAAAPLLLLATYHWHFFGSIFTTGYSLSRYPAGFAFQYMGQSNEAGESIPKQIVLGNLQNLPLPLLATLPLLLLAIPAWLFLPWSSLRAANPVQSTSRCCRVPTPAACSSDHFHAPSTTGITDSPSCAARFGMGRMPSPRHAQKSRWKKSRSLVRQETEARGPPSRGHLKSVLGAWVLVVFGLQFLYEWTALPGVANLSWEVPTRFFLPALFPLVVLAALGLRRLSPTISIPLLMLHSLWGTGVLVWIESVGNRTAQQPTRETQSTTQADYKANGAENPRGDAPVTATASRDVAGAPGDLPLLTMARKRHIAALQEELRWIPSSPRKIPGRALLLLAWAKELEQDGKPVESVFPETEQRRLELLVREERWGEARDLLDRMFLALGDL